MIDTHVHFRGSQTEADVVALVERARAAGVRHLIAVGCEPDTNAAALRVATLFPEHIKAAVGYDRSLAGTGVRMDDLVSVIDAAPPGKVVAIGEIGLDFHYAPETAAAQMELMAAELALARERGLPVIIHSREADAETLELLAAHAAAWRGPFDRIGVLHCFTGTAPMATRLLELGFMLSFSGIVTFRNAEPLRAVAQQLPADRILIETDTPYLTPVPHRGGPNEPSYLPAVAAVVAKARGVQVEALACETTANAIRLFGLQEWTSHGDGDCH